MKIPSNDNHRVQKPDDLDREIALIRQHLELMAFLEERFKPSKTFTTEQVRDILGLN